MGLPATATTPAIPPVFPVPAKVSFDIEWNGATDVAQIINDRTAMLEFAP
jgi:hypothetical protein